MPWASEQGKGQLLKVKVAQLLLQRGNYILVREGIPPQLKREEFLHFKLNFVSCTTSRFELGSFLDSIEHDFKHLKVLDWQGMTD